MATITFGRYVVETSNEDKVFFPAAGITKGDLIDYYRRIAGAILPYLKGRPLTMQRFPDGIEGEGFYQKDISDYFPDWIDRVRVSKEDGTVTHVVCEKAATLVYLADQACITPHIWLSRRDRLENSDLLVFDLDPSTDGFGPVRAAAQALHELLDELGLVSYVQTTGSRGLHVFVPLDRSAGFDTVRSFAQDAAGLLAARDPKRLTTEQRKNKRGNRVFVDTLRNAYGQTAVAPYAVRARPDAPVATPLDWDEVGRGDLTPTKYTVRNVLRRLGQRNDPWAGIWRHARSLKEPRRRLHALRSSERSPSVR